MINDGVKAYLDQMARVDLSEMCIDSLKLTFTDLDDSLSSLDEIKDVLEKEIVLSRKEIVHEYGCITNYLQFVEDIKNEHYKEGTEEAEQADKAIEDFASSINKLMNDIEDKSIALETEIDAVDFCNSLAQYLQIKDEMNEEVSNKIESIIK